MTKYTLLLLLFIVLGACKNSTSHDLKAGKWVAHLKVMDQEVLPFNFTLSKKDKDYIIEVHNADEVVTIDEIELNGDSILIKMPVYEGYIAGTFTDNEIIGSYIKESLDRVVPFTANYGDAPRFSTQRSSAVNISGEWETVFEPDTDDSYPAKGIFTQTDNRVKGTFRTTTGDYRYLEGVVDGDSLRLSTFDGAHAFLFVAQVSDSTLNGTFYSGNHSKEPFVGVRNEYFELPHTDSLTYIKAGFDKLEFTFPNAAGELISLEDPQFKGKVVIVQIMGTWCPNCLDETKFLANYLEKNQTRDLEVIALAFEYAKTREGAFKGIQRLRDRIGVKYPILLAQFGTSDKDEANKKLPMLNHVLSYPTTLYIDKKGKVRKIQTGFNGPATGEKFTEFKTDFDVFLGGLLAE